MNRCTKIPFPFHNGSKTRNSLPLRQEMKNPAESGVSAGFFSVCMSGLAHLYDGVHADLDGLLVHRDEVVVTGRKRLLQSGCGADVGGMFPRVTSNPPLRADGGGGEPIGQALFRHFPRPLGLRRVGMGSVRALGIAHCGRDALAHRRDLLGLVGRRGSNRLPSQTAGPPFGRCLRFMAARRDRLGTRRAAVLS